MGITNEEDTLHALISPYEVDSLFKYRSFSSQGLEDIFLKQQIYLSSPNEFNDPFDCRPRLETYKDGYRVKKFIKRTIKEGNPHSPKHLLNKIVKDAIDKNKLNTNSIRLTFQNLVNEYGIYCLSEKNDDILMWSHYSNAHTGICIEFDTTKPMTLFNKAIKVKYQEEYPIVNVMNLGCSDSYFNSFTTKSEHWDYEQERRIILSDTEGGSGAFKFDKKLLKGVILGARISHENEKTILEWINRYPEKIKLYKANLNETKYSLDIITL